MISSSRKQATPAGKRMRALGLVVLALGSARGGMAGVIFSEDFAGPNLNPAWLVLPGQGAYSVGGGLRYFNQGPLSSPAGWSTTSLSLAYLFTGTSWQVDVTATYSLDWLSSGSYTGPSVPTQIGSSGAQRPQVILSFAPVTASDRSALSGNNYADFDRGTDAWYGDNHLSAWYGGASAQNLLNPADGMIRNNIADGTYWLQFVRDGGLLTMNYSYDGIHYATALSSPLIDPSDPFDELVLSGTTFLTAGSFADYSSVTIKTLDSAPEPGTFILIGLGLFGVGVVRPLARRSRS